VVSYKKEEFNAISSNLRILCCREKRFLLKHWSNNIKKKYSSEDIDFMEKKDVHGAQTSYSSTEKRKDGETLSESNQKFRGYVLLR
jgi:hypothetical protein